MRFGQFDRVTISLAESHVRTNGNGVESVELLRKDGKTLNFDAFVTNVFEKRMIAGSWFPTKQLRYSGRQSSSRQSRAERFLKPDAGLGTFDCAGLLEAGECPVERLASQPQLTCNVLKRTW
jgi:hypothetical protein